MLMKSSILKIFVSLVLDKTKVMKREISFELFKELYGKNLCIPEDYTMFMQVFPKNVANIKLQTCFH